MLQDEEGEDRLPRRAETEGAVELGESLRVKLGCHRLRLDRARVLDRLCERTQPPEGSGAVVGELSGATPHGGEAGGEVR